MRSVSLVVSLVPFHVLFLKGISAVLSAFTADDHHQGTKDADKDEGDIQTNSEVVTRSLHGVPGNGGRNIGHRLELSTPHQEKTFE
jgi:hypothetical protein